MIEHIFNNLNLREYIDDGLKDPWKGTCLENYVYLSPMKKGLLGEKIVSQLFLEKVLPKD